MDSSVGPLFELTFAVDRDRSAEFERWLGEHTEKTARAQSIVDTRVFETGTVAEGRKTWICQLQCIDDRGFDQLGDDLIADTQATLTQRFGEAVTLSSRTLREDKLLELPHAESSDCLNCGTRLRGQYCGICGQRARNRLISLWELISEAFGDLFELDSRLWQTLIPLIRRPGRLTRDYLEGRRARYMPPFRSYLVLSLIFFVVAFFDPRENLGLLFEPEPESTPEETAAKAAEVEAAKQEVLDALAKEGIITGDAASSARAAAIAGQVAEIQDRESGDIDTTADDDEEDCNFDVGDLSESPEWFQRRFTPERLMHVCERVTADNGKAFIGLLRDNIPVALIVLLPLMALVLKVLYPLSRRYFVEHLLFVVHYHAFFFLILTLQILFSRVASMLPIPEAIATLVIVAASLYIPVYLFLALRHVYGQGRILTSIKYVALVTAYGMGATLTMLGAALSALIAI